MAMIRLSRMIAGTVFVIVMPLWMVSSFAIAQSGQQ
jgi:hypothetical protein